MSTAIDNMKSTIQLRARELDSATFQRGQRTVHSRRGPCTFVELDAADPSGATAWVRFDELDEECMVSTVLLKADDSASRLREQPLIVPPLVAPILRSLIEADTCPECRNRFGGTFDSKQCGACLKCRGCCDGLEFVSGPATYSRPALKTRCSDEGDNEND